LEILKGKKTMTNLVIYSPRDKGEDNDVIVSQTSAICAYERKIEFDNKGNFTVDFPWFQRTI